MAEKLATVIGATGLIGTEVVRELIASAQYSRVRIIVRRPYALSDPKVEVRIVDFTNRQELDATIEGSAAVFCAVGTTLKKVGGAMDAYRKVDFEIPVGAGASCERTGCPKLLVVSSVGADSRSRNFYLRLKGEVEDKLMNMNIQSIFVFRPSMLLGDRKESRPAERIAQWFMSTFSMLIPARYKAIAAKDVARAMVAASLTDNPRHISVYEYTEMKRLLRSGTMTKGS
jgi:uncharacterized protein YbjT (DUF2867 family)